MDQIAQTLQHDFLKRYLELNDRKPYDIQQHSIQKRVLKNTLLHYLARLDDKAMGELCWQQFSTANNMTDELAALSALMLHPNEELANEALAAFYAKWSKEALVVDKWLQLQALSSRDGTLQRIKALTHHECFDHKNPNKVYAVIGGLSANQFIFNALNGEGYRFLEEQVALLDPINPQVASRMVRGLMNWRRFDSERQQLMKASLQALKERKLSKDVYEIVSKSLN
jgi:aminopeptidase N